MRRFRIHLRQHKKTGLWLAMADEFPGFVVHAHSDEELDEKLGPAFESYMDAIGTPVRDVTVERGLPADYWPPEFQAAYAEAA